MLAGLLIALQQGAIDGGARAAWVWEGRVHDAFTGAPMAGVHCELWTEDLYASPRRVAECWTGADGTYALPDDERKGEKLVLRRAGHRSTEVGTPEDELRVFPALEPHEWRVVDLEGRPIESALVRTRQSCRHAIPAVEQASDALGIVRIPDLPPLADGGDLEILAEGRGALGKLAALDAWSLAELALPRRRPVSLRCLDDEGRPVAAGSLRYQSESGGHPLAPDAHGRVRIGSLFDGRDGVVLWRRGDGHELAHELDELPAVGEWTLRFGEPGDEVLDARVVLHSALSEAELRAAAVRLVHEGGWIFHGLGEHEVPAGVLHLVVGAPFSGVREETLRIALGAGEERRQEVTFEAEPRLRLRVPEGTLLVHVEAGEDSITLEPPREPGEELETPVPPGRPVTVFALGRAPHRARLSPWSGTTSLDLATSDARVGAPPSAAETETVELRFRVRSAAGAALTFEAEALALGQRWPDLDPAPEDVLFRLPRDARWEARFRAGGCTTLHRAGRARASSAGTELVLLR